MRIVVRAIGAGLIDNVDVDLPNAIAGPAANPAVNVLGQSISSTQAQVQAIQNKFNELINAITRPAI